MVEAYRVHGRTTQRIVANLGRLGWYQAVAATPGVSYALWASPTWPRQLPEKGLPRPRRAPGSDKRKTGLLFYKDLRSKLTNLGVNIQ